MPRNATIEGLLDSVHIALLKPKGFVKRSGRSESREAPFHRAVTVLAARTNTNALAEFDLNLVVAHDDFNPYASEGVRSGIGQQNDCLARVRLRLLAGLTDPYYWQVCSSEPTSVLAQRLLEAFSTYALPVLDRMRTLEGIAEFFASQDPKRHLLSRLWVLKKIGMHAEAGRIAEMAIQDAPVDKRKAINALIARAEA